MTPVTAVTTHGGHNMSFDRCIHRNPDNSVNRVEWLNKSKDILLTWKPYTKQWTMVMLTGGEGILHTPIHATIASVLLRGEA